MKVLAMALFDIEWKQQQKSFASKNRFEETTVRFPSWRKRRGVTQDATRPKLSNEAKKKCKLVSAYCSECATKPYLCITCYILHCKK